MSRIIVKNLPIKADELQIKDHFKSKGDITDVKLLRKRDGTSRKFAFIGFKSNEQAQAAANYFNDSFMTTSKLSVEVAKDLHDETLVSSRERRRLKRQAEEHEQKAMGKKSKSETDGKLREYLDAMKPQSTTAMWRNDAGGEARGGATHGNNGGPAASQADPEDGGSDSDSDIVDLTHKQGDQDDDQAEEAEDDDTDAELERMRQIDEDQEGENDAQDERMTDLDWLKVRRTRIKDGENANERPQSETEPSVAATQEPTQDDKILETGRLFLRNLSYMTSEPELVSLFSAFGTPSVHIPTDPKTDKSKGIAFVSFAEPEKALSAYHDLDGTSFQGRLLHILAAKPSQKFELDEFDIQNMPLKKQLLLKKKASAAKQQFSWNSLYLNRDAVLETAAKKLGVSKSEMLDPHSSNMAVKAALAESSVLESVQTYFKSKGVDLAKLETKNTTDKIILVKNIPFGTSQDEISDLFAAHGEVVRVLMPQEGGVAIVQFASAAGGRSAFSKLAFRRLGNSILYLQKAPKGLLEESEGTGESKGPRTGPVEAKSAQDLLATDNDSTVVSAGHVSVFVKNLNFSTTSKELTNLFKASPGFASASVKTKPSPTPNKVQSLGYGFAEFNSLEEAETAIKAFQGYNLDNHKLELKISTRGREDPVKQKGSSSKIIIKNVPFETTRQDIYDLFGTFGKLRSVRLPRKFNKQTRGFAFAEYATTKEAETAMASLTGAHLLGRRLVMEFAQVDAEDAEEEIARMERKIQNQVDAEHLASMRSTGQERGFDMDEE